MPLKAARTAYAYRRYTAYRWALDALRDTLCYYMLTI